MNIFSLSVLFALSGALTSEKAEPACCASLAAKAPAVKVVDAQEFVCPITGAVLPCPDCCPLNAEAEK